MADHLLTMGAEPRMKSRTQNIGTKEEERTSPPNCHGRRNKWQGTIDGETPEDTTYATYANTTGVNNPRVQERIA